MKPRSSANSSCNPLRAAVLASFAQDAGEVGETLGRFGESAWRRELEWLDVSGLALYLLDHLRGLGREEVLPAAVLAKLRRNAAENRARTAALLAEAVEINRRFDDVGVLRANLKGVTLSPVPVPDPSLRLQLDLDLLIREADADKARSVLEGMGYGLECKVGRTWQFRAGSSEVPSVKDIYKVKPQRSVDLHLSAANGLLARAARREFFGAELPALGPVDLFLTQAEHLFKHLCGASTRASWALEARRHIAARAGDGAFWQSVGERLAGEPRLALAVAVVALLVEELFGDALPGYLSGLIEEHVPAGVRLWVERYGLRVQLSGVFGTKHYLLLLAELPKFAAGERGSVRSGLVPRGLPPMIAQGFAGETVGSRWRRYGIQLRFLVDRMVFHGVEGLRYLLESFRFRRLLTGVGLAMALALAPMAVAQTPVPSSLQRDAQSDIDSDIQSDVQTDIPNPAVQPPATGSSLTDSPNRLPKPVADVPVLTAAQIEAVLDERPEAMVEVKELVAVQLQRQGFKIQADSIDDETLYSEIAQSPALRATIANFLHARGYLPGGMAAALAGGNQEGLPATTGRDTDPPLQDGSEAPAELPFGLGTDSPAGSSRLDADGALTFSQRQQALRGLSNRSVPRTGDTPSSRGNAVPPARNDREAETHNTTDAPKVLREPAPYNLLSMRDLYTQIPEREQPLKRFGSEMFTDRGRVEARAGSALGVPSQAAPLDIPIGPDYVVGPGDSLSVNLWGGVTQSFSRVVDREGRIVLPDVGVVQVAGLTLGNAQGLIEASLKPQFRDAHVSVTVARLRTVRVYVVGDVQRPGAYDLSSLSSPLSALYAAGGPTAVGSLRTLRHLRGDRVVAEIDLYDFLLHGVRGGDRFEGGDTLLVPPAGPQVAISGAVKRPAIYELKGELKGESSLAGVLEDAGGASVAASLAHITVERIDANQRRETVTVKLPEGASAESAPAGIADFRVKDGDRVRVSEVAPFSQRAVYLEGHVVRPGRLAYRDGMELKDVLQSYRDLLPEPAARGEIVRLVAPDLHAETIEFDLGDALIGNVSIALEPFDTIRVHGRYEVDAPRVTVRGEVLRPGAYPLSAGMTAAQLVRMAGGFKRDALQQDADLTSYRIVDGGKVAGQRSAVRIGDAVTGDRNADVALKPGDILTIHQIAGWDDIGNSVTLEGEVSHPGSYGFQEGERLSSVLRRAGGFRDTAYPDGAVLIRKQVRVLEEKSRAELIHQIEATSAAARLAPNLAGSDQTATLQLIQQQQDQVLARLRSQPASGRLVIRIGPDIASWANTDADIEVRQGDVLTIPKRPGFVLVSGQVYNASALTFVPGKLASWYLERAGGASEFAARKEIFIIRANGSVVGRRSGAWYDGHVLSTRLEAGDVVVVPQKIVGASQFWRNLLTVAQIASSTAITAVVAGL